MATHLIVLCMQTFLLSKKRERSWINILCYLLMSLPTHNRRQLSTLLSQCGVDVGVIDMLDRIPNE